MFRKTIHLMFYSYLFGMRVETALRTMYTITLKYADSNSNILEFTGGQRTKTITDGALFQLKVPMDF